jgi:hypothetical protein
MMRRTITRCVQPVGAALRTAIDWAAPWGAPVTRGPVGVRVIRYDALRLSHARYRFWWHVGRHL